MLAHRELEAAEAAVEATAREERRRQERKNRDAFTALLRRHAAEGRLSAHMRFKVRQVARWALHPIHRTLTVAGYREHVKFPMSRVNAHLAVSASSPHGNGDAVLQNGVLDPTLHLSASMVIICISLDRSYTLGCYPSRMVLRAHL